MSWIPCPSSCSISTEAAPGSDAQGSGTGWIWDTPGPRHGSKNLPARSLWVMSIMPCRLIHYSRVNPCAVAWKWNIKRDFYINIYLKVLLRLLARLKRKVLCKATLAQIRREGTGVLPGISKEWLTAAYGSFPGISTPTCDYSSSSFSPPSLRACFWATHR